MESFGNIRLADGLIHRVAPWVPRTSERNHDKILQMSGSPALYFDLEERRKSQQNQSVQRPRKEAGKGKSSISTKPRLSRKKYRRVFCAISGLQFFPQVESSKISVCVYNYVLLCLLSTEGGTRSDASFCHKFSCGFHWPVGHTAVAVQPSK